MFKYFKKKIQNISKKFLKIKSTLGPKIISLFSKKIDDTSYEQLEQILYEADLGVETSVEIVEEIQKKKLVDIQDIFSSIKEKLRNILINPTPKEINTIPYITLIVGVNGSGKTTSIAKLANKYKNQGKKVLIAAADTFRAAAVDQLESWAKKIGVDIVKSQTGSDPAAVVFDALKAAMARDADIVLIDTAGRLQNKTELMLELEKIKKIIQKQIPTAPHATYLTLDATTGQNAIDQVDIFNKFTPIDGIVLAKLDGSSKGGIIVAIAKKFSIPVTWVGIGEKVEDLIPFEKEAFINELLNID